MVSNLFLVGIFVSVFLTVYAISFEYYDLVPKTITEHGYPFENHTTVTEDGYILSIFRIPHRGNESEYTRRTPVVISHGFFGFSLDYLLLGPKHGLAFILADSGFDVWLMNSRGSRYSRKHLELNDTQSEFWNYSYHEIGVYDTPAVIDYILNFTKYEELVHVGHSHGVTSLFVMLSEIPEYNKKVKAHIAMSPGVYYCNYKVEGLRDLALMERLGTFSDMRRETGDFNLGEYFSQMCTFLPEVCGQIVESREVLPEKFKTAFFRYYPDGGSFKQAIHSSQAIAWCTFGPYVENIENPPPLYNLSNVVAPIYAFYGDKDTNVNAVDVIDLGKDLPGGFAKAVLLKNWRHLDFMLSSKARNQKTITKQGYPFENYTTVTKDGYILSIFRIPHGRNESEYTPRTPVLISHGLLGYSLDYLLLGPTHGLGFILADSGFDVWLMNSRGTRYSRSHIKLNNTQPEFWNYTYHEIGIYDTPAVVDCILNVTKQDGVVHIGHSQGVTSLFVMLSEKPEYNKKIKAHLAMSPGVYYCNYNVDVLKDLAVLERVGTFSDMRRDMGDFNIGEYFSELCTSLPEICSMIVGSREKLPGKFKTEFFKYYPDGGSFKQAIHSGQAIAWCKFRPYVESIENPPPLYNISNVAAPIYAFYGDMDTNVNAIDVVDLGKDIPGGFAELILLKNWRHLDFMLSSKAKKQVYLRMVDIINKL